MRKLDIEVTQGRKKRLQTKKYTYMVNPLFCKNGRGSLDNVTCSILK